MEALGTADVIPISAVARCHLQQITSPWCSLTPCGKTGTVTLPWSCLFLSLWIVVFPEGEWGFALWRAAAGWKEAALRVVINDFNIQNMHIALGLPLLTYPLQRIVKTNTIPCSITLKTFPGTLKALRAVLSALLPHVLQRTGCKCWRGRKQFLFFFILFSPPNCYILTTATNVCTYIFVYTSTLRLTLSWPPNWAALHILAQVYMQAGTKQSIPLSWAESSGWRSTRRLRFILTCWLVGKPQTHGVFTRIWFHSPELEMSSVLMTLALPLPSKRCPTFCP